MGDTANGSWGSRDILGFQRREAARQASATREVVHGISRSVMHAHVCRECGLTRCCMTPECPHRATDREREWVCVFCDAGESIT